MNTVKLRTLLNGDYFSFLAGGQTFERYKTGFRTHPDGDNGRWFPLSLDTYVYPSKTRIAK